MSDQLEAAIYAITEAQTHLDGWEPQNENEDAAFHAVRKTLSAVNHLSACVQRIERKMVHVDAE